MLRDLPREKRAIGAALYGDVIGDLALLATKELEFGVAMHPSVRFASLLSLGRYGVFLDLGELVDDLDRLHQLDAQGKRAVIESCGHGEQLHRVHAVVDGLWGRRLEWRCRR